MVIVLYEPAPHAVHTVGVDAATTLPYEPTGHAVHTDEVGATATLAYFPTAHTVHTMLVVLPVRVP